MRFKHRLSALCLALAGLLGLSCGGQSDRVKDAAAGDPVALALAVAQDVPDRQRVVRGRVSSLATGLET